MITTIDGKIHHLKELAFIEKMLADDLFDADDFYGKLKKFLEDKLKFRDKEYFNHKELEKLDNFVRDYFSARIEDSKIWLVRSYVIGRMLASSDILLTEFAIGPVSSLPKFAIDAARKYGLTIEEAAALTKAVEDGASLMTNTTVNTIQTVRNILIESYKRGNNESFYDKIREAISKDVGELNRDWQRTSVTETNSAFNNGYLALCREGDYVVGYSMPDACEHCDEDIRGKVYRVRKTPAPDYSNMSGEEYEKWADVWENEIWEGKNNFGRSTSLRKRIDKSKGNKEENLIEKYHHEFSMPAIPFHPTCRCRWIKINTEYQWVDKDGMVRLRAEDEDKYNEWYKKNIHN